MVDVGYRACRCSTASAALCPEPTTTKRGLASGFTACSRWTNSAECQTRSPHRAPGGMRWRIPWASTTELVVTDVTEGCSRPLTLNVRPRTAEPARGPHDTPTTSQPYLTLWRTASAHHAR